MITASLKNYRIAPRKVRLVADMVRGKTAAQAKIILENAEKKAKHPLGALLASALANAMHNHKIGPETLIIKEIRVDQGYVLKRSMPMARGSAFPMKKRTSHVSMILAPAGEKALKKARRAEKKAESATKSAKTK